MSAGGGDAVAGDGVLDTNEIVCTICLDAVIAGERSFAQLICGHKFHLDCISAEFNRKGAMKCPNCRGFEDRDWPFATFVAQWGEMLDDWLRGRNLDDLDNSNEDAGLAQGEISSGINHNHPLARHEASRNHPCPYSSHLSLRSNHSDGSTVNSHWSDVSAFPPMDAYHNSMWGHPFATTHWNNSEIPRSAFQPFVRGHRPNNSAVSSMTSSTVPPAVSGPQTYFRQPTHNGGRSSSHRGSAHLGPMAPASEQQPSWPSYAAPNAGGWAPWNHRP